MQTPSSAMFFAGAGLDRAPGGAEITAQSYRAVARLNVSRVTAKERTELLQERQALLRKKMVKPLSPHELNRLAYVRWSLDRIEDAQHGEALDALSSQAARYGQVLKNIRHLQESLQKASTQGPRKKGGHAR
jgi:hypothetical protein